MRLSWGLAKAFSGELDARRVSHHLLRSITEGDALLGLQEDGITRVIVGERVKARSASSVWMETWPSSHISVARPKAEYLRYLVLFLYN